MSSVCLSPRRVSALRELELRASAFLTVLFAFFDPGVPRQEPFGFQGAAQVGVHDLEGPSNPQAQRVGLTALSAALHRRDDVDLSRHLDVLERLAETGLLGAS